jgi:hypothetical protein
MAERTDLLVIGAGPYAYSAASCARDHGIDTRVVGIPMSFWREQMPADMFLRSGPDWHLDVADDDTFEAYASEASRVLVKESDDEPEYFGCAVLFKAKCDNRGGWKVTASRVVSDDESRKINEADEK